MRAGCEGQARGAGKHTPYRQTPRSAVKVPHSDPALARRRRKAQKKGRVLWRLCSMRAWESHHLLCHAHSQARRVASGAGQHSVSNLHSLMLSCANNATANGDFPTPRARQDACACLMTSRILAKTFQKYFFVNVKIIIIPIKIYAQHAP